MTGTCRLLPLASLTESPLTLNPGFSPSIHDYWVLCSTGTNTLTLGMTAAAGGSVWLSQPFTTSPAASASATVSLAQDQAAVVVAQNANGFTQDYWLRCLPHDFPSVSIRAHPAVGNPTPGWYLIGNVFAAAGSGRFAMIVDANGTPIWYHRTAYSPAIVEPLPNSTVGITGGTAADLYRLDTWTKTNANTVGVSIDLHELLRLPNGNFMLQSYPQLTGVNLNGLTTFTCTSCTILDCAVQEIDPNGNLVWDWRASNHVDPVRESMNPSGAGTSTSPADVYHCNSVDADSSGNVLISFRHLNSVLNVSKSTGQVLWKLGGTAYSKDGAQILTIQGDPETSITGQHDARFRPNGAARFFNISLFDDHSFANLSTPAGPARGLEYAIDRNAGTAQLVWQYQAAARSAATGSFRRYADGTNLVGWGNYTGTDNLIFSDVDDAGKDLLDMLFVTRGNWTYRAEKVPIGTFDVEVLRGTAGLP